jgi:hypothetical protein
MNLTWLCSPGDLKAASIGRTQGDGQGAKALFREAKSLNPQQVLERKITRNAFAAENDKRGNWEARTVYRR